MAEEKKAFRLEVVTVYGADGFSLQYDTEKEANIAAEQIVKQGFAIYDYTKDESTSYHRCYIPLVQIRSLDVVEKGG